jgi:TRAP-type mannitol/chloroaromatic compound transport system permease large subunit
VETEKPIAVPDAPIRHVAITPLSALCLIEAGYDVKLASGVIRAGGTLGIPIPPSVMIIVYAAVAGQWVVKVYAAAMFPGFFPSFPYLVYIVGKNPIHVLSSSGRA